MHRKMVAPFAGAWIEIEYQNFRILTLCVAPFAGAWIEIMVLSNGVRTFGWSLRSPERGLKYQETDGQGQLQVVAPFAGAWIEMSSPSPEPLPPPVAPFAGAWIEIVSWF